MSTARSTEARFESTWLLAAIAGLAAGFVRPALVAVATAAGVDVGQFELALQHELPAWWAIHVAYSLAFALVYDVAASGSRLGSYASRPTTGAALGAGYGTVLWAVNVVVLWTVLMKYVLVLPATEASVVGPFFGHLLYGAVLGVLYPLLRTWQA